MIANLIQQQEKNNSSNTILDKLAQLRKNQVEKLKKRAKSKFITIGFIYDLIKLEPVSPLKKSYINTLYCADQLLYDRDKNKITGKYCNNRWCLVCNRIRTAKLMNGYFNEVSKIEDKHFLTLTIPNVPGDKLELAIEDMQKNFRRILDLARKKSFETNGIRKLECTYSFVRDDYHPHYHIVGNKLGLEFILSYWLIKYPEANERAQNLKPADENSLKELFKYFTKVVTRQKGQTKNDYQVFIRPLDIINQAFYRKRVFQGFGNIHKQSEDIDELQAESLDTIFEGSLWEWEQDQSDWVSEYGEYLTGNDYHEKIKIITK